MLQTITAVFAVLLLGSCAFDRGSPSVQDAEFEAVATEYLEEFLQNNPEWATDLGDHRFDDRLGDYSQVGIEASLEMEHRYLAMLEALDPSRLSPVNATDFAILKNRIEESIFATEELREHEWNPLVYNVGGSIYGLLSRDFAPEAERLRNVAGRLRQVPAVLAAARDNLQNPPQVHTETAIVQNPGTISLIRDQLEDRLAAYSELKAEMQSVRDSAIAALEEYGEWLETDLLPRSDGDFRLGAEKFRRKLAFTLHSDLSMEDILSRAEARLEETQEALYETALPLYRSEHPNATDDDLADKRQVIRDTLDRLAEDRPTDATIVEDARNTLAEATCFVGDNALVSLPAEPVEIIVMPEFRRGVSTAYCDSPGPLEENGKTFYAIAPTPEDWSVERAESLYREYNDYMLLDLTVHEAMPGHYVQLAHSNRFQAPTLTRHVFYSGSFVEGWAVYAEQLLVEHGLGGAKVKMQQLKMYARAVINAILDQKIHAGSMTEQEAMDLMMNEGFQEEGEAAGKWRRASLTSGQLSTYFVGNEEVWEIRNAWEARNGEITDWQAFHDTVLSHGSPPAKFIRRELGL
jgi:uncharacterized protein (DUF885 family)